MKFLLLERGIKRGMEACIRKQYTANNEYILEMYDSSKPSNFVS